MNKEEQFWIEELSNDLAYERIKFSSLFRALENEALDEKAKELAVLLRATADQWIVEQEEVREKAAEGEERRKVAA